MSKRIFLERRTYRRNRLQDAAKLLPVLGVFLFFGPILILSADAGDEGTTSGWLVYFFVIWLGLIALTAGLSAALARSAPEDTQPVKRGLQ